MWGRARHQSGGEGSQGSRSEGVGGDGGREGGREGVRAFLGADAACARISADALRVFVDETLGGLGSVRWCVARIPQQHRLTAHRAATQALVLAIKQREDLVLAAAERQEGLLHVLHALRLSYQEKTLQVLSLLGLLVHKHKYCS